MTKVAEPGESTPERSRGLNIIVIFDQESSIVPTQGPGTFFHLKRWVHNRARPGSCLARPKADRVGWHIKCDGEEIWNPRK